MRATLLIYSGRENPGWSVGGDLAQRLEAQLSALAEAPPDASPFAGLGYSGVRLDFTDASGRRREAVIGAGIALVDGRPFRDDDRRLERAILADGRGRVPEIDALG